MNQYLYTLLFASTLLFTITACDDDRPDWDYNLPPGGIGEKCRPNWIEDDNGKCYCPQGYYQVGHDCIENLRENEYFGEISGCDCTFNDIVVKVGYLPRTASPNWPKIDVMFFGNNEEREERGDWFKYTFIAEVYEGSRGDSIWGHTKFRDFTPCSDQGFYAASDSLSIDASYFTAVQTHPDTFVAQLHYWYVDEQAAIGRSKKVCHFLLHK